MENLPDYRSIPEDKYLEMERRIKKLEDENEKLLRGASIVYLPKVRILSPHEINNDCIEYLYNYEIVEDMGEFEQEEHYKNLIEGVQKQLDLIRQYKDKRVTSTLEKEYKGLWLKCKKELTCMQYINLLFLVLVIVVIPVLTL